MPELGKYAFAVLVSYGWTALALIGLVALSWARSVRVRRRLERAEGRRNG